MATCPKCGGKAKAWSRDMFTGVCANCLKSPQRKKTITNRQYKTVGLFSLLSGGVASVTLGFGFEFKEAGPLVLFAAAALMGILTFLTKPLRLVCFLGPGFVVSGILAVGLLDGDLREDWGQLIPTALFFVHWLIHCTKTPIESSGATLETTDNTEVTDATPPGDK